MFSLDADDDVAGDEVFLNVRMHVCVCVSCFYIFKGVAEGVFNVSGCGSCCLLKKNGFLFFFLLCCLV